MNKHKLLFLLLMISSMASGAEHDGFIITAEGDTIECTFTFNRAGYKPYISYGELISSPEYTVLIDEQKVVVKPTDLRGYGILIDTMWKFYVPVDAGKLGTLFAKKEVEGGVNLYTLTTYNDKNFKYSNYKVLEDPKTSETVVFSESCISCRRDVVQYFQDCPVVAEKIKNKTYKIDERQDWPAMVAEYNQQCPR